ncbi:hypothetical protein JW948_15940 [bacterium]|nr:hypothetical protein [bacterium]
MDRHRFQSVWQVFIIGTLLSGTQAARAGFSVDVSTWIVQDRNAFQNYEQIPDVILQPSVNAAWSRAWSSSFLQLSYQGAYSHFQTYTNRRYQNHYGGFSFQQYLGQAGPVVTVGIQSGQRINQDSLYNFYDYQHLVGYLNLRRSWGAKGMTLFGAWMQKRLYKQIPEFDFQELRFFVQQHMFLPTRTTLIGRVQWGLKRFLESTVNETVIQTLIPRLDDPGAEPGEQGGSGQGGGQSGGRGRGSGGTSGTAGTGPSSGLTLMQADTTYETVERTVRVEIPGQEIMQWTFSLRAAQSVFMNTGLAVEGRWQRRADGEGRLLSYQDSGYEEEDPLFDDPYNYDSDALSIECTQKLPWGLIFKGGWDMEEKQYYYRAYDLNGQLLPDSAFRKDSNRMFWFMLKKRFSLGPVKRAEISVSWHYLINHSNEAYSDYEDQLLTTGWSLGF